MIMVPGERYNAQAREVVTFCPAGLAGDLEVYMNVGPAAGRDGQIGHSRPGQLRRMIEETIGQSIRRLTP